MTYNGNWNSPENKKRRRDAEHENISREWDRVKDGANAIIFRPMWWALAISVWTAVGIKYLEDAKW